MKIRTTMIPTYFDCTLWKMPNRSETYFDLTLRKMIVLLACNVEN